MSVDRQIDQPVGRRYSRRTFGLVLPAAVAGLVVTGCGVVNQVREDLDTVKRSSAAGSRRGAVPEMVARVSFTSEEAKAVRAFERSLTSFLDVEKIGFDEEVLPRLNPTYVDLYEGELSVTLAGRQRRYLNGDAVVQVDMTYDQRLISDTRRMLVTGLYVDRMGRVKSAGDSRLSEVEMLEVKDEVFLEKDGWHMRVSDWGRSMLVKSTYDASFLGTEYRLHASGRIEKFEVLPVKNTS